MTNEQVNRHILSGNRFGLHMRGQTLRHFPKRGQANADETHVQFGDVAVARGAFRPSSFRLQKQMNIHFHGHGLLLAAHVHRHGHFGL